MSKVKCCTFGLWYYYRDISECAFHWKGLVSLVRMKNDDELYE